MRAPFILTLLSEDGYQVFAALHEQYETLERAIEGAKSDYLKRYGGNPAFRVYHAAADTSGFRHTLIEVCFDESKPPASWPSTRSSRRSSPRGPRSADRGPRSNLSPGSSVACSPASGTCSPGPGLRERSSGSSEPSRHGTHRMETCVEVVQAILDQRRLGRVPDPDRPGSFHERGRPHPPACPVSIRAPLLTEERLRRRKSIARSTPICFIRLGRAKGQQVRVSRGEDDFAIFTVAETLQEPTESILRMGRLARVRFGSSEDSEGRVSPTVVVPGLTEEQARAHGELIERLDDDGTHTGLLIMAPHGGEIEPPTDLQAERLAEKLAGKRVSVWRCKGYHPRGGKAAFDRWHITSTDVSEASYPLLAKVAARKFEYAVSFHGMTDDRILIGGAAPTRLRLEVRDAIRLAINDPRIAVDLAIPGDANGGKDPRNIVNRYVPSGGVQIEQSARARRDHWKAIADAVAKVYASKL